MLGPMTYDQYNNLLKTISSLRDALDLGGGAKSISPKEALNECIEGVKELKSCNYSLRRQIRELSMRTPDKDNVTPWE